MTTLLQALLRNESGGRNIPNVHQGTSSGQAQGYFQITTGTWDEFGGRKYAANPLGATYEQQAEIASRIPLKRWDESTVNLMRQTGRPINVNATLGENLAANGETFAGGARDGGGMRHVGGAGSGDKYFAGSGGSLSPAGWSDNSGPPAFFTPPAREENLGDMFAKSFGGLSTSGGNAGQQGGLSGDPGGDVPPLDYASAVPKSDTSSPDFDLTPLAQLFQLKNIGQAPLLDQKQTPFPYG